MKRLLHIFLAATTLISLLIVTPGQKALKDKLSQKVESFEVTDVPPSLAFERLAKAYSLPVGFEALPGRVKKQQKPAVSVKLRDKTTRDVINAIVQADARYTWREHGSFVSVIPKNHRNPLLDVVISHFQVDNVDKEEAIRRLMNLPQVKTHFPKVGLTRREIISLPGDSMNKLSRFSLKLNNVTVREAMSEIAKAAGSNYWIFFKYGDHDQYYSLSVR